MKILKFIYFRTFLKQFKVSAVYQCFKTTTVGHLVSRGASQVFMDDALSLHFNVSLSLTKTGRGVQCKMEYVKMIEYYEQKTARMPSCETLTIPSPSYLVRILYVDINIILNADSRTR